MRAHDMALDALLTAGKQYAQQVPEELLRKAYEIQIKYQFEEDEREIPLKEMSRMVEDYVNKTTI